MEHNKIFLSNIVKEIIVGSSETIRSAVI